MKQSQSHSAGQDRRRWSQVLRWPQHSAKRLPPHFDRLPLFLPQFRKLFLCRET